jgi:ribosomal protein L11 methyltransferase
VQLLDRFPQGIEDVDGGFAVYTDGDGERWLRESLSVVDAHEVAEGWEDGWRAFHHGVVVGRFWVGPPWEDPPAGADAIVVDPGRAFGTGAHPTTRLTLALLQEQAAAGALLDVGCGSGVLSVAAAKLGFAPVVALDVDEAAVEAARENAGVNGVEIAVRRADALAEPVPPAALVLANVALDVVEALLPRLSAPRAVTSGYLDRDRPEAPGWRPVDRRERNGWAADVLERA